MSTMSRESVIFMLKDAKHVYVQPCIRKKKLESRSNVPPLPSALYGTKSLVFVE